MAVALLLAGALVATTGDSVSTSGEAARTDGDPLGAPVPAEEELSDRELVERFGDAVWRVETSGCGVDSTGSAFAVDEHHLITNWHVVVGDSEPALVSREGTRISGRVVGSSEDPDVAVIEVDETLDDQLRWADTGDLAEGQHLLTIGYPAPEGDFSATGGGIVSFQERDGAREAIRTDGAIDKGNSGGPALTTTGEVAGVATELAQNQGGLQLVGLLYTRDALQPTIDELMATDEAPTPDCDAFGTRPEVPPEWEVPDEPYDGAGGSYGDDPELDALWDACEASDWAACDDLYLYSPIGSEYESFGITCGDRGPPSYPCTSTQGAPETPEPAQPTEPMVPPEPALPPEPVPPPPPVEEVPCPDGTVSVGVDDVAVVDDGYGGWELAVTTWVTNATTAPGIIWTVEVPVTGGSNGSSTAYGFDSGDLAARETRTVVAESYVISEVQPTVGEPTIDWDWADFELYACPTG